MLLVEENHVRTKGNTSDDQMLYTSLDGGRGRGATMEEGVNQVKAKTAKGSPMNTTSTGKTSQPRGEERLEEGGAIMPVQAVKTTPSSANIVANSATMTIMVECS